jgi:hypothetical protein
MHCLQLVGVTTTKCHGLFGFLCKLWKTSLELIKATYWRGGCEIIIDLHYQNPSFSKELEISSCKKS